MQKSIFKHSSKSLSKEELKQLYSDINLYYRDNASFLANALLDSSLITRTKQKKYTCKIIKCGNHYQVYYYNYLKIKNNDNIEKMKDFKIIDEDFLFKKENFKKKSDLKYIEFKNINRTKFQMQRLVKANEDKFKTFITLTFERGALATSTETANKYFQNWTRQVRRYLNKHNKEFYYIAVPEYQKKREKKYGIPVIHYHILCNLEINSDIIIPQKKFTEKQLLKMSIKKRKKCYDVKYWSYGFSSVYSVKDINVVGYMSKYMTKEIDHRLFGRRRYFYSLNLDKPEVLYVDDTDFISYETTVLNFVNLFCNKKYEKNYLDKFGNEIKFIEYDIK